MHAIARLLARYGTYGAYANASRALAEEREVAAQLDRFLLRFGHPAGGSRVPVEPRAAGDAVQVA